jgi:hypothetical protein
MRAVEVIGTVNAQHQIQATVPTEVPQGPVRLIVLIPEEEATATDALTAAMDAVCSEVDTRLEPALLGASRRVLERSEWESSKEKCGGRNYQSRSARDQDFDDRSWSSKEKRSTVAALPLWCVCP